MRTPAFSLLLPLLLAWPAGCHRGQDDAPPPSPSASASAVPVDRLAEGELSPGTEQIWGLVLPRGMHVIARFPKEIHAAGPIAPEEVANYVRERVVVSRVELGAARTIFPATRIKGDSQGRLCQIEIASTRDKGTILELHDVSPPKVGTQGLDDAQRLRQVGLTPDGKLLDPSKLE